MKLKSFLNNPFLTLILVPLLVYILAPNLELIGTLEPDKASLLRNGGMTSQDIFLKRVPEESTDNLKDLFDQSDGILVKLPKTYTVIGFEIQANPAASFHVTVSKNCRNYSEFWTTAAYSDDRALVTRVRVGNWRQEKVRCLKIQQEGGKRKYGISYLKLSVVKAKIPNLLILIAGLLLFGAIILMQRHNSTSNTNWLVRLDPYAATILLLICLFRLNSAVFLGVVIASILLLLFSILRFALNKPRPVVVFNLVVVSALLTLFPFAASKIIEWTYNTQFLSGVDHRPSPGGDVNSDSLLFRGEAKDMSESDFNVLFMGDSFTWGCCVKEYEDKYPYAVERVVNSQYSCKKKVRMVNFAWPSSSPILGLRALHAIGSKYKPNLVVYNLDLTDYHDDIGYEPRLSAASQPVGIDAEMVLKVIASKLVPANTLAQVYESLSVSLRDPFATSISRDIEINNSQIKPFFIINQPLESSIPLIERGVVKYLGLIHEYAENALNSRMLLVLIPRGIQYSDKESPKNWEASMYDPLGPYVTAYNAYFEQKKSSLPYPVLDLLPSFRNSGKFPLFMEDDPHWNKDGQQLAAEVVAKYLVDNQFVPCRPWQE